MNRQIEAARLRDRGRSYQAIARKFGWTLPTTKSSVSRGRKWPHYLKVNTAGTKRRRAEKRRQERPAKVERQLKALLKEARSLGLPIAQVASL